MEIKNFLTVQFDSVQFDFSYPAPAGKNIQI
jgi:hypothetical protein